MIYTIKNGIINIIIAQVANLLRKRLYIMKKFNFNFLAHKVIGLMSLALGIHFIVAHFNKVFPFGLGFENNELMFIWAYTGCFIGAAFVAYGIMQLFHKTVTKFLRKIERGEI